MKIIRLNEPPRQAPEPCVATIGFFDGVHLGHQFLIRHVRQAAAEAGLRSMVITFDRHPRQVLAQDYQPRLLTTLDDKLALLEATGIDEVALLHFSREMAALTAREFMRLVLRDRLNVRKLVIGYDNRFGHNRAEGFDDYVRYGRELGIEVIHNPAFVLNDTRVSSSVVRSFIGDGEVALANQCLGYPFTLSGTVGHGFGEGHKLGYPTANLDVADPSLIIPANGVYAVSVRVGGDTVWHRGMMNIGVRPTFDNGGRTLEVNILDFDADIYGRPMTVALRQRMRAEQRFDSPARLAAQLRQDERAVRDYFNQQQQNKETAK
jgi:riboflavin kinase/FMN adenylyltransferase